MDFPTLVPKLGQDPQNPANDKFWPGETWVLGEWHNYESRTIRWCKAAYEEATYDNEQQEETGKIQKYIDYIIGKQWSGRQPSYKAKPVDNRVWRLFWELVSLLTDIRPIFDFRASNPEFKHQSDILNKTTKSWWMFSDCDQKLAFIVIYALFGVGYGKLDWDPSKRNGEGDFDLIPCGTNDVLLLKPKNDLQEAQCLIYQSVQPLGFFRKKYPLRGSLVRPSDEYSTYQRKPQTPSHLGQFIFNALTPAMKRKVGTPGSQQESAAPMALYREFWLHDDSYNTSDQTVTMGKPGMPWSYQVKSGMPLYPRGRLIVMGGDDDGEPVILEDGPNPWLHGEYPFAAMRFNAVPWQFAGYSELRNWLPLQDIINLLLAGALNLLKKIVNPPLIYPRNAFDEAVADTLDPSAPGLKLAYSQQAGSPPQYGPVPNMPPILLSFLQAVGKELEVTSGTAAVNQALQKKQVPGGETLEKIQQSQQTTVRLKGRAMEVFLRDLGKQVPYDLMQCYSKERRIFMLGPDGTDKADFDWQPGTMVPAGVEIADHAKSFQFLIQPGTLLALDRARREQIMMGLRKNGDISRETLFNELELGVDSKKEEKLLIEEAVQKAKLLQLMKGGGPGGGPGGGGPQAPVTAGPGPAAPQQAAA